MKKMKKFVTLALVLVMVLGLATSAFAAETGTITITPPTGVDKDAVNTYKIYKVFDAVGTGTTISYTLVNGKTTAPAGFTVSDQGNVSYSGTANDGQLTAADIAAIAAYVSEADLVDTVTTTGSAAAVSKALPNGYYYITTSTGTVVTINSTNPKAEVSDKNTVPTLDKKITGASSYDTDGKKALAQVGTKVNYDADITVGDGAKGYVFHDTMESSLTYNGDAKVYIGATEVASSNYTVGKVGNDTFTITFNDDYIKTLNKGDVLTVKYSATVNSDALTVDPATNTAYVSYGDANSNNRTPDSTTDTYNAKFTVTKHDGNGDALAGAGFVLKNSAGEYYKMDNGVVTWVNSIEDADEKVSGADGAVPAFTGLANGTYTLVENTVPEGYNKAQDETFTVAEHDYSVTNLEQSATVVNNAGNALPATGGMGTTLFYVFGAIMVLGAAVLLVTKKRMAR